MADGYVGRMRRGLIAVVVVAWLVAGCSAADDSSSPSGGQTVCAPGKSEPCTGPAGCQGGQVCKADGSGYEACVCADAGGFADSGAGDDAATDTGADGNVCGDCGPFATCVGGACKGCGAPDYAEPMCGSDRAALYCPLNMPLPQCNCSPAPDGLTLRCCCPY